jgi:pimeloyl-ACP methyl ester carboxylesterase
MATSNYQQRDLTIDGARIRYCKGGEGPPLIALHSVEGHLGWLPLCDELARDFTVYAPIHPGFAGSDRPAWLESLVDLSRFYLWIVQELGISKTSLLGHGMGGWIAAEMAVMAPSTVDRLILISAVGVRPREGEITDIFLHGADGSRRLSFVDTKQVADYELLFGRKSSAEDRDAQLINREAATRYCWKPYMHDPALPHLLPRLRDVPTLIVWGRDDRIVPVECGELYHAGISGSRLEVIDRAGHFPHLEHPAEFTRGLRSFLNLR